MGACGLAKASAVARVARPADVLYIVRSTQYRVRSRGQLRNSAISRFRRDGRFTHEFKYSMGLPSYACVTSVGILGLDHLRKTLTTLT